ncbi:MAG: histone deacetylase [Clostridiaceae bacterium]|nr:histone deacetylase [Clostridiaceae bacterium]
MMQAKNKLGLVFFPAFDWAISPSHPEREERLLYTQDQLFEEGIQDIAGIEFFNPVPATEKDVQRVHFAVPDVKTRFSKSHMVSMGGAIEAFDLVFSGRSEKSFALVRPPGHHAHRVVYGDRGFCVGNIEAVGLEAMRTKYGDLRVAVIDTDCHHGDGTEDIYWNDPDTLFISFHQDGRTLYPGTGYIDEAGGPGAYGYNINIPLPPKTGEQGYLYVLDHVILPILAEYKPDLIVNSAGQDNHYSDPITNMNFTAQGYAILNEKLNPDVAILEGGYSIESALPYVNTGIILAMAGLDYSGVKEPDYDPSRLRQDPRITEHIKKLSATVYERWQQRDVLAEKEYGNQKLVSRKRNIFYDTDGIMERQTQNFKVCSNCSGLNYIDSRSDRGSKIKGITIPRDACRNCQKEGYELYEKSGSGLTNVYLQDRVNDRYLAK